jgi:ribose transport system permease protein
VSDVGEKSTSPDLDEKPGGVAEAEPVQTGPTTGVRTPSGLRLDLRLTILIGVFLALIVVGYILKPDTFLSEGNISTMLRLAAGIGVVSVGMTFVIISGGIDLSVGSLVGLASVWMTTVATQDMGPFVMVPAPDWSTGC